MNFVQEQLIILGTVFHKLTEPFFQPGNTGNQSLCSDHSKFYSYVTEFKDAHSFGERKQNNRNIRNKKNNLIQISMLKPIHFLTIF